MKFYNINKLKLKVVFAKAIFALIVVLPVLSYTQENPFVYMEDNKLYHNCEEYYPLTINYGVHIIGDNTPDLHVSPIIQYCTHSGCWPWFSCGGNIQQRHDELKEQFEKIVELGFNTIRIVGLALNYNPNYNGSAVIQTSKIFVQQTNNTNCYDQIDGIIVDDESEYDKLGNLIQELVDIIYNNGEPMDLKLIILTGKDGVEMMSDTYSTYLSHLAYRFKDEPVILGYDLYNEPIWYSFKPSTATKIMRAETCLQWYNAIKPIAPAQFVTIGSKIYDVFDFDPQILPVDFISFHPYVHLNEGDNWEYLPSWKRYKVTLQWMSEAYDLPFYTIGETGFSGINGINPLHPIIGTEQEQLLFAVDGLRYTNWYGAKGYSWWMYKDIAYDDPELITARNNYYGLVRMDYENGLEITKPAGYAFPGFQASPDCELCVNAPTDLYLNPNPGNMDIPVISGKVTKPDEITGIGNVLIWGTIENADNPDDPDENSFAITDEAGDYELRTSFVNSKVVHIRYSYPGMGMDVKMNYDIGLPPVVNAIIDDLDPSQIPQKPVLETYTVGTFENQIWESENPDQVRYLPYKKVIIEYKAELTINIDVFLSENAKIIVKPGGKLTIDGARITSSCGQWCGIEVWGNPNVSQYEYNGVCLQGIIELKNGATIENANVGVLLGAIDDEGNNDYSKGGGIIKAEFVDNTNVVANFKNNKWGVRFMPYHNYKTGYTGEVSNLSIIEYCTFDINQDYLMGNWWFSHIHMYNVTGISISGNTFVNNKTTYPIGHGINAWQAGFKAEEICDDVISPCPEGSMVKNTFTNFGKGVNLHIPNGNFYTATVKNAEFFDNSYGIVLTGVNNASLLFNKFELGEADKKDAQICDEKSAAYGIDLTGCMGFAVEENEFSKATGAPLGNYIGIRVTNCPSVSDVVYKNSFDGVSVGNQAEGINKPEENAGYDKGVTYFCNENMGNSYDFYVAEESTIANYQGWNSDATGNTLSPEAVVQFQNDYPDEPIIYFFDQNEPDEVLLYENVSEGVYPTPTNDENTCPSHYGGINPKNVVLSPEQKLEAEQDYATNLTNYNNVKALFDNLKDGGNTEATLTDVATAWPNEMWELRAKLLGDSPHLSMEVLKAASDKTDVLPESVLFEILSANPDELKKEELIKYLEDKQNPLPAYMVDILRQLANGTTYKTVLLSEMAAYNAKKVGAAQDIIRSILNSGEPDMDELRNWLDNIGGMEADKQIIGTYISEGNYTSAQNLIDMLPVLYELEGDALLGYNDYKTFTGIMMDIEQDGRTIFDLDATEHATMVDLAENGNGSAKISAQGLLEFAYGYYYCNCPDLPEGIGLKSSSATIDMEKLAQAKGLDINVEPNPTSTWTAFDYTLPLTATEAVIKITDNSGKTVQQVQISQQQGQYVLDTRNYKSGIYFYTLTCGDLQRTGKLIVK